MKKKQKENVFDHIDGLEKERHQDNLFNAEKKEKESEPNFFEQFNNIKGRSRSLAIY